MTQEDNAHYDLIVLGGGPAGSTVATLVAMQKHRVLVLEREQFPRHQLGESLLPATVHGICPLLGVSQELAEAGFPRKRGGTFRWGKNPEPWTFAFAKTPNHPAGFAYQVERSKFDKILLDNARRKGAEVLECHSANSLIEQEGRVRGVTYVGPDGHERRAFAPFVADTGGHRSRFHERVGERVHSKLFQNVAIYAYFENGKRLPAPNSGNILSCAFGRGWFWYIPLSETLTSVGAVVSREAAVEFLKGGHEEGFRALVAECPLIQEYLAPARRVTEGMYGEFRVRKDYSYCNTRFWKPGLMLLGDAAAFIDPVFSSGVHLATYSALLAARSINTCLRGGADEVAVFDEFEHRYRREFGNFYQFLTAFYDMHEDEESYFWRARKVLNTEEKSNDAFVRLIAGLGASDEPIFRGAGEFFEARAGLGQWFQGMLARNAEGVSAPASAVRFDPKQFDPDEFMKGFTSEITQMQMQALYGDERPSEAPLTARRLVPSLDGLHWDRASDAR